MVLFQFKRMPFGLSFAGATFQRLIDKIIGPDLEPYAFSYLDDIVIATETLEEHKKIIKIVLEHMRAANLTIDREKSVFCRFEVKYLGVLVNKDRIRPDPEKIELIVNYPDPRNLKQVCRFLRMSSWYREFLKDFATLTEPLTKLTSLKFGFNWGEGQERAFGALKTLIASVPLLHGPNFEE